MQFANNTTKHSNTICSTKTIANQIRCSELWHDNGSFCFELITPRNTARQIPTEPKVDHDSMACEMQSFRQIDIQNICFVRVYCIGRIRSIGFWQSYDCKIMKKLKIRDWKNRYNVQSYFRSDFNVYAFYSRVFNKENFINASISYYWGSP